MNEKYLTFIQTWVECESQALEWTTRKGRTYQVCGIKGATGFFERHFHADSHPTRRSVSATEVINALESVDGQLELYRFEKGSGMSFENIEAVVKAAKEYLGVPA